MSDEPSRPRSQREGPVVFATTHWTRVLASQGGAPDARQALSELCGAYYAPVVAVLRRELRSDDEAREIAHDFFETILERHGLEGADPGRGRFRSYLLGALKHFLANRRVRAARAKRGGGAFHEPLDSGSGESGAVELADAWTGPDAAFDRAWALRLLERAFAELSREARVEGSFREFQALKPWLGGDAAGGGEGDGVGKGKTPSEVAAELGWSDGAFRVALHRLRRRFREVVKQEIAGTVSDPADVEDELRHLIAALA